MKNSLRFLLLMMVFCLLLSGSACGKDATDAPSDISTDASTEEDSVPSPPAAKELYYFMLINSAYLTASDQRAVTQIAKSYSNHDVFIIDVKGMKTAIEVREHLRTEAASRTGTLDGIQIMGSADMVPSFLVDYKIMLNGSFSKGDAFFSDYFYSDFENDSVLLERFNIADCFSEGMEISFTPCWRVIRLPLGSGEFAQYVDNYQAYLTEQKAVRPRIACFSSSIFRYGQAPAVDDLAYLLERARDEWKILPEVSLYTNQKGSFLSPVKVLGDIGIDTLKAENAKGVTEFFILGHGLQNQVFRTCFTADGTESQEALFTFEQIPEMFSANPYYLNFHSCSVAQGMDFNMIRTALNNGCLGSFAATSPMANNGVSCTASVEEMKESSNFFYFYYSYLKAIHDGATRSQGFFEAQKNMAAALGIYAKEPINYGKNYQFGYHNLLTYANFGILEPETARFEDVALGEEPTEKIPLGKEYVFLTQGKETGKTKALSATLMQEIGCKVTLSNMKAAYLDNGYVRISFEVKMSEGMALYFESATEKPYSNVYNYPLVSEHCEIVVDVSMAELEKNRDLLIGFLVENGKGSIWFLPNLYQALR